MGKKTENKEQPPITSEEVVTADLVYDLESLYTMKFIDKDGTITMVRKAFGGKPRGRLEFYHPEN